MRQWLRSFRHAWEGLEQAISSQRNMKIHLFFAIVTVAAALMLDVSAAEVALLHLAITLVMGAELINTALEKAVDVAMPRVHPWAKAAKDTAASAVLVAAFFAVGAGLTVFFRPADRLLLEIGSGGKVNFPEIWWLIFTLVLLTLIAARVLLPVPRHLRPDLFVGVIFFFATALFLYFRHMAVGLAALAVSLLLALLWHAKQKTPPWSLFLGAVGGSLMTAAGYMLVLFL